MKKILVIIPAYNEKNNIVRVVENLINNYPQYDYVIINDGSKDGTGEICKEHNYNLIDLPVNLGLAGGFQTGLKYAYKQGYEYAIQYDADGQHKAEYIEKIYEEMKNNKSDIVIGSRFLTEKKPFTLRMLGSFLISFFVKLTTGKKINDPTSGMRMLNKKMIKEFALGLNYGPEPDTISYLIKHGGVEVSEVQIEMDERIEGESYLTFTRSMSYMFRIITSIVFIQSFRKREKRYLDETKEGDA